MKKLLIIAFSLFVTSVFAQSINPTQHSVIKSDVFGSRIIPNISYNEMVFTPDGSHLFMVNTYADMDGVLVVYSTNKKSVVKKFAIKKQGFGAVK